MAIQIQLRHGTTTEHNTFKGAVGEVTVDTDKKTVVVHDGTTVGGTVLAKVSEVPSLVPQATEVVVGKAKIATTAIAQAGTNDTDFITSLKLKQTVFGVGQTWQNLTSSRVSGTIYTNTTGRLIAVKVSSNYASSSNTLFLYVNEIEVQQIRQDADGSVNAWADLYVPAGSTYRIDSSNGFSNWSELR